MTFTLRLVPAAALVAALAALPALAQTTPAAPEGNAAAAPAAQPEILPDVVMGQADAPVTVIEYASFTCSHCAAFHTDVFPTLKSEYIDTGKVRFIQRDVYFDEIGLWAGILAHCGGDQKYHAVSGMLLSQQKTWLNAKSGDEFAANLRKMGAAAGFSNEQMDACWADNAKVERLLATFQKNATADQVEGTPTFVINGEKVQNQPWDALKAKIDEKLAEAGTAPAASN
ncbi:MAG TPA: DsbA family protein [Paracoccus sp. (in: a-proteobacteria)]|nr:DsbA family protein [Paracoccus sp. (in: a-proteobacteria)]